MILYVNHPVTWHLFEIESMRSSFIFFSGLIVCCFFSVFSMVNNGRTLDVCVNDVPLSIAKINLYDTGSPGFNTQLGFKILFFRSGLNRNTTDEDTVQCKKWSIRMTDIPRVIKNSRQIDGVVWDLAFSVLTCQKKMIVEQNNHRFTIVLNAGSFFSVSNSDTTEIYGNFEKSDRKYFLVPPGEE